MVFWDITKNHKKYKYIKNLLTVDSYGSFCLITSEVAEKQYFVILCNARGSPVDCRCINIKPTFVTMNKTHIIIANESYIYMWHYMDINTKEDDYYGQDVDIKLLDKNMMKEIVFYVDDIPNLNSNYDAETFRPLKKATDPITAISSNKK